MYNYFMLVGLVASNFEIKEVGDGKKVANIFLSVRREFKDMNGDYIYDLIRVTVWDFLAEMAYDTLKKGSKIGVKGRIVPKQEVLENGYKTLVNNLVADRIIYFDDGYKNKADEHYDEDSSIEE